MRWHGHQAQLCTLFAGVAIGFGRRGRRQRRWAYASGRGLWHRKTLRGLGWASIAGEYNICRCGHQNWMKSETSMEVGVRIRAWPLALSVKGGVIRQALEVGIV